MGREVKRVASDFNWPLEKTWEGYLNPWYQFRGNCYACDGNGYDTMANHFYGQWYGNEYFDPIAYGSQLLTPESPAIKQFVENQVDRSIKNALEGTAIEISADFGITRTGRKCRYTDDGKLTREEAIERESLRLLKMWNRQWSHHLIQDDVQALVDDDRLYDFTYRPLKNVPIEEYIKTHAYYLWIEAGCPKSDGIEFWLASEAKHKGFWLPFKNGYVPTAREINDLAILSIGHDAINAHVCIKARCEREGYSVTCPNCGGDGNIWYLEDAKQKAEDWTPTEPPTGNAYQIWETVSEGSPISPAFENPKILAEWMANSKPWGASEPMSAEQWLEWIVGPGWAPSGMIIRGEYKDGVLALLNS